MCACKLIIGLHGTSFFSNTNTEKVNKQVPEQMDIGSAPPTVQRSCSTDARRGGPQDYFNEQLLMSICRVRVLLGNVTSRDGGSKWKSNGLTAAKWFYQSHHFVWGQTWLWGLHAHLSVSFVWTKKYRQNVCFLVLWRCGRWGLKYITWLQALKKKKSILY